MQTINTNHPYAKTWWQHTDKAIKRGEPTERRFAVVGSIDDPGEPEHGLLLAWKVDDLGDGMMRHPAFGEVAVADVDPFVLEGPTANSTPTALFQPDSLYCLCI